MDKAFGTPAPAVHRRASGELHGTLTSLDGTLYVIYATTEPTRPIRHTLWWAVSRLYHDPYTDRTPLDGDEVEYRGDGVWSAISLGSGGAVKTGAGTSTAEIFEQVDVLPPAACGKELRWGHGKWEKLLATGWVAAGEGSGKRKARACG